MIMLTLQLVVNFWQRIHCFYTIYQWISSGRWYIVDVLKSHIDNQANEYYLKTNLNLFNSNFDETDWIYLNKSHWPLLLQSNVRHMYDRHLTLNEREKRNNYDYTNSFRIVIRDMKWQSISWEKKISSCPDWNKEF
jgi:hypothetical protein